MSVYQKVLIVCLAIILSSCATTPVLTGKGEISREVKQKAPLVSKVDISPDGRYVLSGSQESFILWDVLQGKKIQTFIHPKAWISDTIAVAFSPDGKYFASGGQGTKLWNLSTKKEIRTFDDKIALSVAFSPDGKYLLSGGIGPFSVFNKQPSTMKIFDVATGSEIIDFKFLNKRDQVWSVAYSPDGKHALSGGGSKVTLWDISLENSIRSAVVEYNLIWSVAFSPDGKYALSCGRDNIVRLWNANNLKRMKNFIGFKGFYGPRSVAFSPDSKYILACGYDGNIKIWELASGTEWKVLAGHTGGTGGLYSPAAKFSPNGKYVISAGDASTRIWDVATGQEIASMIAFEDGEWIITTPNGYYTSSPKGDQYLSVTVGGKEYTTEQLRESFYRPDLVQVALSGGSLKELKRVADVKPPPEVAIVDTPKSTDANEAAVNVRITDAGGGIGDVRLYLNGTAVLLDSARGVKLVATNQNEITKTYKLKLSSGLNAIRAIAFNADNTMQSNPAVHEITASFKTVGKPSLYALVIGINDYKNPKLQLQHAIADAALFADTLKKGATPLFDKVEVKILSTKEETTRENILKELKSMQSLNPDDLFVFYVPDGHLKIPHLWPLENPPPSGWQNGFLFSCFSFLMQAF